MARKSTRAKAKPKSKGKGVKKAAASKRSKRQAATRSRKAAKAKAAPGKARAEKPAAAAAAAPAAAPAPTGGTVLAAEVHLGHFFALRPRVETAFRPDDLRRAKQALAEERYRTIEDAARAVAEKALELARGVAKTAIAPFRG
jgi:hypothetical protein